MLLFQKFGILSSLDNFSYHRAFIQKEWRFFQERNLYHLLSNIGFSTFSSFIRQMYCYSLAKFIPVCRHEVSSLWWRWMIAAAQHRRDVMPGHIRDIYPYCKQQSSTPPSDLPDGHSALSPSGKFRSRLLHTRSFSPASLKPPTGQKPFQRAMRSWCLGKFPAVSAECVLSAISPTGTYSLMIRRSCNFSSNVAWLIKSVALGGAARKPRLSISLLHTRDYRCVCFEIIFPTRGDAWPRFSCLTALKESLLR